MLTRALLLAVAVASCAPSLPYVSDRPVEPFAVTVGGSPAAWFADGRAGTIVVAHNPTDHDAIVHVRCEPSAINGSAQWPGTHRWAPCVRAHGEERYLAEFPMIDALRGRVCWSEGDEPAVCR